MKTKNILVSAVGLSMILSSVALAAFANESDGHNNASTTASTTFNKTKDVKIREVKDEGKVKIDDLRLKMYDKQRKDALNRYQKTVQDLQNVATRTAAMITNFQAKGIDMSSSSVLLNTANAKIAVVVSEMGVLKGEIDQTVSTTTSTTTRQDLLNQVKTESKKIDSMVKDAKDALNKAVKSINDLTRKSFMDYIKAFFYSSNDVNNNASSSDATSSTTTVFTSTYKMGPEFHFNWGWFNPMRWFGRR